MVGGNALLKYTEGGGGVGGVHLRDCTIPLITSENKTHHKCFTL